MTMLERIEAAEMAQTAKFLEKVPKKYHDRVHTITLENGGGSKYRVQLLERYEMSDGIHVKWCDSFSEVLWEIRHSYERED